MNLKYLKMINKLKKLVFVCIFFVIINNIIKLNTGKADIIASGTLFNTIDHPASATYCKATKNTANTEIPKKK